MAVQKLFPTQVWVSQIGSAHRSLLRGLVREALVYRKTDEAGKVWSRENYPLGYTSYSSITDLPFRSSQVAKIKKWIDREVGRYAEALEMDLQGGRLEMRTCWVNVMGKGSHHSFHLHPLSAISGTFYVHVPKNSGKFRVEDPRMDCFMASPPRKSRAKLENRQHISFDPKPGMLLLFESWLRHEVTTQMNPEERISISFNYDWVQR